MTRISYYFGFVLMLLSQVGNALPVTYTYTGNNFTSFQNGEPPAGSYDTSMSVSGFFQVESALSPFVAYNFTPLSYSFTDGRNLFTSAAPPSTVYFEVVTNAFGQIDWWNIQLRDDSISGNTRQIMTFMGQDSGVIQVTIDESLSFDTGWINSQPGSWSVAVSAVPEPGPYELMLGGLALLGFAARRRKRKAAV